MGGGPPPPPPGSAVPGGAAGASTAAIVEVDASNFEAMVIKASMADPPVGGAVIVDAYADWCQPCKQLTPKLESLVSSAGGAVRLAKLNVDLNQELAASLQIKSLPTVLLVHKGKLADSFTGAVDDQQLAAFVRKAADLAGGSGAADRALEQAQAALAAGDVAAADQLFRALGQLPEHGATATAGIAMCALQAGDRATAQSAIAHLHAEFKNDLDKPLVRQAIAQVDLLANAPAPDEGDASGAQESLDELRARAAAAPDNLDLKFDLATALVAKGEAEEAVGVCLDGLKKDMGFKEGEGKELLMKIFESLGNAHPVTKRGRRKLANLLFS